MIVKGGEKTKSKKLLISILILLSVLVCMGCVAAQDANSTDLTVQDTTSYDISPVSEIPEMEISEVSNNLEESKNNTINDSASSNDKLAAANNEEPLSVIPRGNAFVDIYEAIELAGPRGTVDLEKTTYIGLNPIEVSHSVTINGHGAILDARGIPLIFRIHEANVTIINITFINCRSIIDGGAVHWSGKNGKLVNCTFKDNKATIDGGALYWTGDNGNIVNCNFINNSAGVNGGAIYFLANNCKVENCTFTDNTAQDGGAIHSHELLISHKNNTISNSNFINNTAKYKGGAVYFRTDDCKIDNCNFIGNTAQEGGAVYYDELLIPHKNNTISNSNFTNNTADYNGGAVYLETDNSNIINSFFDGNIAEFGGAVDLSANNCNIDSCGFTENTAVYGGAVYCGEPIILRENNTISNCIFTSNIAENYGGALYIMGNYTTLDLDYFNNNAAIRGSAIYINRASEFVNISNTEFGRNTADSLATLAVIENNETYALANVTIDVYFIGYDNIANAIWKNGEITSIQFYNITCEFSKDGKGRSLKKFNMDGFANPTEGFEDESKIWQSTLENAQLVDILVTDETGSVVLNITNGVDTTSGESENSASQLDNTNLIVTDTNGIISVTLPNLKAGKYTVLAKHEDDQYYTACEDNDTFVVYELNVTKISEKLEYDVDEEVKYTIVVNNKGNLSLSDVTIVENIPEEFYSDMYFFDKSLGNNSLWQHDNLVFTYQEVLHPHEVVTLVLVLFTSQNGTNITNSITVSSNLTDAFTVESNNITVYRPSMDISKTAVNSTVFIGDQAVFIINVTNSGDRPLTPEDTIIYERFINELIYDHITGINGEWYADDAEEGIFILNSTLDIDESASFEIYFNTTELGEYENIIVSWYAPKETMANVTVIKIPTETVVGDVTTYPDSDINVTVNVTAANNKPVNGEIIVTMPDGDAIPVTIVNGSGSAPWHVPEDYAPGNYSVSASFEDDWYEASNGNGVIAVNPKVNLTVVKTANVTTVANNTLVNFTITITNYGPSTATNVEVSDLLPQGLTYVEAGAVNVDGEYAVFDSVNLLVPIGNEQFVTFSEDNNIIHWRINKMTKGTSVVLLITAKTNGLVMGNLTNEVTVNYSENETDSIVNSTDITVVPVVLTVEKTGNVTKVGNNTFVEFTIIVNNTGAGNATDVYVRDALPQGFAFVDATEGYDEDLSSWIIDCIPAGDSITLNIIGKSCEIGNWTNYAMIVSNENDTLIIDSFKVEVALDNLTVVKSANATNVSVGDSVEFTINVTNTGLINANDIEVSDLLDSAFEVQTIGNDSYLKFNDTEKIVWNIPSLDVGKSITLSVVVKLLSEGTFNNTAAVKTPNSDETKSTANVTALKIPTYISVENVTAYPGMNVTIHINVTTDENKAFSGNATIQFPDGSIQTVIITNGNGNVKWFVLENHIPGVYNDTVSYSGDNIYLASSGNGTITVESIPTTVVVENVIVKAGQNVTITVNVTTDNNNPFNGDITVTLPNGSAENVEVIDGSGEVVWYVPEDYGGNYSVSADYSGNEIYLPSYATGIVNVIPKISIDISVSNETAYPDSDVTVTINVTAEDGKPFNGEVTVIMPDGSTQTVEIVDGVASSSLQVSRFDLLAASTSTIGTGTADWHVPGSYAPGNYPVLAEFEGNDDYFAANGTGNIEVIPIPTEIKVDSDVTGRPGQNVAIPINVTSDDNKPFNGVVAVTLPDGSNQTVEIIDGSGNAIWPIPEDYNGTYEYTVNYPGNETFLPSNATGSINVIPKVAVDINAGLEVAYPGDEVSIPIEFIAEDGTPVNANVTISLDDGTTQNVEIIEGKGNIAFSVPRDYVPGEYNFTVYFDGNDDYLPSNGTATVIVVQLPVDIIVGNVTAKPGDNITIPIKVIPHNGFEFNGNVTVELPDGTKKVVEIIAGEGSADWNVPNNYRGVFQVNVISNETEVYCPANGTGFITVIPEEPPVDNGTVTAHKEVKPQNGSLAKYETGNPILALLAVLTLLGVSIKRKK
ncbi:hypothetical protein [Methanobrevibacter sp.]